MRSADQLVLLLCFGAFAPELKIHAQTPASVRGSDRTLLVVLDERTKTLERTVQNVDRSVQDLQRTVGDLRNEVTNVASRVEIAFYVLTVLLVPVLGWLALTLIRQGKILSALSAKLGNARGRGATRS